MSEIFRDPELFFCTNLSSVLVNVAVALFNLLTKEATLGAPVPPVCEDDDDETPGGALRPRELREALEEERAVVGVPVLLLSFSAWR